jgi:hypothetical protein
VFDLEAALRGLDVADAGRAGDRLPVACMREVGSPGAVLQPLNTLGEGIIRIHSV